MSIRTWVALVFIFATLSACGQKGALVRPDQRSRGAVVRLQTLPTGLKP